MTKRLEDLTGGRSKWQSSIDLACRMLVAILARFPIRLRYVLAYAAVLLNAIGHRRFGASSRDGLKRYQAATGQKVPPGCHRAVRRNSLAGQALGITLLTVTRFSQLRGLVSMTPESDAACRESSSGVVVVCSHLGSHHGLPGMLALFSSKLGLVAQGPDYASRVFRYGNRVLRETTLVGVPDHTALVRVLMLLRAKTVMALHVDGFNSATSSHEPVVRFLGIDVVPPMGIERLTSRPGIATAEADIRRVGNSPLTDHFKFRYQLLQPPFDVVRLLRRLEEEIQRCPDEWLFWHRYGCLGEIAQTDLWPRRSALVRDQRQSGRSSA